MKIFAKIMARVIVLPLLLAAGLAVTAVVTMRVMFTPSDLQALVTDQLQEFLKRPVQISSARLSTTGEIQIRGLRVTEPGPETVDFLKADYIYATYKVLPLLKRRLEMDSVVLVAPEIRLIRRADGSWNVGDILSAYRSQAGGRGMLNRIAAAEVKDGRLSVYYAATKRHHYFENFNAGLSDFTPDGDIPFHASVFLKSDAFRKPVSGRIYAEGKLNFAGFEPERASAHDLRLDVTVQEKKASFAGHVKNFRLPEISLRAETPQVSGSDLAYMFQSPFKFSAPRASWDIYAVLHSSAAAEFKLTARPLNLRAEGLLDLSRSTPSYTFTVSAPPLTLDLLARHGVMLPVEQPSGKAQIRLKISSGKDGKPVLSRFFLNASNAGFRYRNLGGSGLNLAALLSENFAANYANLTSGRLQLGDNVMENARLKTEITKDLMLYNYSGSFNGSRAKGRIAVRQPFTPQRTFELTGYSTSVVYSEIKGLVFGVKDLRGPRVGLPEVDASLAWLKTLKNSIPMGFGGFKLLYRTDRFRHEYMEAADFYAQASLSDITGDISKIRGDISVKTGPGAFYDVQRTSEKDRVFYLFSLPLTFIHRMNRVGALKFGYKVKDINFNSIGGDYYADGGKVQVKNFYIDGKEFSAYVTGDLDFQNETMDVKIYTMSGKYYSMGSLPEALTDSSGKPALAFTLKGRMADPKFEMMSPADSGRLIREAAQKGAAIDFARIDAFAGGK